MYVANTGFTNSVVVCIEIITGRQDNLVVNGRLGLRLDIHSQDRAKYLAATSCFADNIVVIINAKSVML